MPSVAFKPDVQSNQYEVLPPSFKQAMSYRQLFEVNRAASSLIQSTAVMVTRMVSGGSLDTDIPNVVKNLDVLKIYFSNKGDITHVNLIDSLEQRVLSLRDGDYSHDWVIKNVIRPIKSISTNVRKEVRIKILNSVPVPVVPRTEQREKTDTKPAITPPEIPSLNVDLSPISEKQDESSVDWKGLGEETERKVLQEETKIQYDMVVNDLSKGYIPDEGSYQMSVAELNTIDAIFDDGYRRALENLGLEKEIPELTDRVLSLDLLASKGVSIYPVAYVTTNEDNTALIRGYYPVLVRVILGKDKTKIIAASPVNGESVEQEVSHFDGTSLNKTVGNLLEHAEIQPGDYFLTDGTRIHKSKPKGYMDAIMFSGIIAGGVLTSTGELAPVGTALVYSGTAYFAGKSAYNLYNQIRFNTFDLASPQTQIELGVLALSLVPAAKMGISRASKTFGLSARVNIPLHKAVKGVGWISSGLAYTGGTGYNAEIAGEQIKEGKFPLGPLISEAFIIGGSAFCMYYFGKGIVRDARLLKWHMVSEKAHIKVARSVEDVNRHAVDYMKDLPGDQKVYYYSVDKRSTNAINTITSKKGGDYILSDYRRMLANISRDLNRAGYKTTVIVHGGDEASILTTADHKAFFKVFSKHEATFRTLEEHALRDLVKSGVISPSEKSGIMGVNLERGEMGSKPAGEALNQLVVENRSVKEVFSSVLAQDTPELRVVKGVFLETGKPVWSRAGRLDQVVRRAAKEGRETYYIMFEDRVADPKVKDAFAVYSKNNGGKGIIRLNNGELAFVNYNNVDHSIGDSRLWINESGYPKEMGKYYEVYMVKPNEYILITPKGEDINGFVRTWESGVNSKLNGVRTSLIVTKVPSNVNQLMKDPLYLAKKAAYRVITYNRDVGSGKNVVFDRAVQYLKDNGFDLDNLPRKIRASDLTHLYNHEGRSMVDVISEFGGFDELLKGDIQGFDVTEYLQENVKKDFIAVRRGLLMYAIKSHLRK